MAALRQTAYLAAVKELFDRVAQAIGNMPEAIRVYVAGGAAVHWWTRARVTADVDAEFAHRHLVLDETIVSYQDENGDQQQVYLDRNYNPNFSLLHENYQQDAVNVGDAMGGLGRFDIHVLSPVDLAVSKLSRWAEVDRGDVLSLAKAGLLKHHELQKRAIEALEDAIGCNKNLVGINIQEAVASVREALQQ